MKDLDRLSVVEFELKKVANVALELRREQQLLILKTDPVAMVQAIQSYCWGDAQRSGLIELATLIIEDRPLYAFVEKVTNHYIENTADVLPTFLRPQAD